jgi:hypothetical protein
MVTKYIWYKGFYNIDKCRPEQLVAFASRTTEELLDLILSESPGIVFKCLNVLTTRELTEDAIDILKEVNDNGGTFKNRRLANNILRQLFPEHSKGLMPGESRQSGYVYFIKDESSSLIKIGRTKNIERRMAIFRKKFKFAITLLQHVKTLNYERIELALHKHYDKKRVRGEWFKLDSIDIEQILQKSFPKEVEVLIVTPNSL